MRSALVAVAVLGLVVAASDRAISGQKNTRPEVEGRSVCVPYDPATLTIQETPEGNWRMERGDGAIFKLFVDREDAEAGLAVARQHNQLCYIGKSNTRPDRLHYIMEYWRKR